MNAKQKGTVLLRVLLDRDVTKEAVLTEQDPKPDNQEEDNKYSAIYECVYHNKRDRFRLEQELNKAIQDTLQRGKNGILIINTSKPFELESNRSLLSLLANSGVKFQFMDFKSLTKETIEVMLELFSNRNKNKKSEDEGQTQAAGRGNPDLRAERTQYHSIRKKQQLAFLAPNNERARVRIRKLLDSGYSYNKTSKILNEEKYLTPTNRSFHAAQVKRLKEADDKIKALFAARPGVDPIYSTTLDDEVEVVSTFPIELEEDTDFRDFIVLVFSRPVETPFKVIIKDNEGKDQFEQDYPANTERITIDILAETYLFPGRHYLILKAKELYESFSCRFYIHKPTDLEFN